MSTGTLLIVLGLALAAVGLLVHIGALAWFGQLPGDVRIERGHIHVFIPITSMLVVSVVVSAVIHIVRRLVG
ncbi:MAG: DUF2905 domain-containing protein [Halofilum sp. (in: g-proteobacteria)]